MLIFICTKSFKCALSLWHTLVQFWKPLCSVRLNLVVSNYRVNFGMSTSSCCLLLGSCVLDWTQEFTTRPWVPCILEKGFIKPFVLSITTIRIKYNPIWNLCLNKLISYTCGPIFGKIVLKTERLFQLSLKNLMREEWHTPFGESVKQCHPIRRCLNVTKGVILWGPPFFQLVKAFISISSNESEICFMKSHCDLLYHDMKRCLQSSCFPPRKQ